MTADLGDVVALLERIISLLLTAPNSKSDLGEVLRYWPAVYEGYPDVGDSRGPGGPLGHW